MAQQTKAPLLTTDVRRMVEALPDTPARCRDCALLLLGFAGGFRRSELAALNAGDLLPTDGRPSGQAPALENRFRREGKDVGIPYGSTSTTCPVRALTAGLTTAGLSEGALFRGVDRHWRVGAVRAGRSRQKIASIQHRTLERHSYQDSVNATSAVC
jgi:hypothetical protein